MSARVLPFFTKPGLPAQRGAAERAFLPAALEIIETPASPTLRITAAVIASGLAVAFIWSYFGHVDIIASAPGKIIARSSTKVVQSFDQGVVREIRVMDGDKVEAGQTLVELDPTISEADQARYSEMLVQAEFDQARLKALLAPAAMTIDPFAGIAASPERVASARARLEAEQGEQAAKLAKLDREAAQKRSEEAAIDAQIAKIDASLPLIQGRASIREEGMKGLFGSKLQYLEAQQAVVETQHERVVQARKHDEAEAALAELTALRSQAEAEFRRGVLADLAKADHDFAEATGELAKADKRTSLQSLSAPVAGLVQDLTVHTLGGVVTPGQQLLRIVPLDGGIEVEAVVSNQDVGFVRVGQRAEVKIDAFPFTRYGVIPAHVRELAHDSVDDPQGGQRLQGSQSASDDPANVERSRQLVYVARLELDQVGLTVDGKPVELVPGMAVTAEIKTGKRRVLDYLLSPIHRYSHDVLRER